MIGWAWRASAQLGANWRLRSKFVLAALSSRSAAGKLENAAPESKLGQLISDWPDTVGFLLWPYQCSAWGADERIGRIQSHLAVLEQFPGLQLGLDEKLVLANLSEFSPETSLVIDRAKWLSREGHLTLSLFKGEFRAFTTSFSFSKPDQLEIFIGGIQGRQTEDVLDLYRDLTKDFHGMRPRDFMLEALRLLAVHVGAKHLYAVAEAYKISRHEYFGAKGAPGLFYDDIWEERGGVKVAETHFELPLAGNRRDIEEIPAKKRSMYRRRYEMLDQIAASMPKDFATAARRHFDAK